MTSHNRRPTTIRGPHIRRPSTPRRHTQCKAQARLPQDQALSVPGGHHRPDSGTASARPDNAVRGPCHKGASSAAPPGSQTETPGAEKRCPRACNGSCAADQSSTPAWVRVSRATASAGSHRLGLRPFRFWQAVPCPKPFRSRGSHPRGMDGYSGQHLRRGLIGGGFIGTGLARFVGLPSPQGPVAPTHIGAIDHRRIHHRRNRALRLGWSQPFPAGQDNRSDQNSDSNP